MLTGSSAMLAEAAHSFADTLNQVFLFTSVRQGARPADRDHPFGYGQERYFWSLLAAFGIFVAGAGFSIFEGILSLHSRDAATSSDRVRGAGRVRAGRGHLVPPGHPASCAARPGATSTELLEHVKTSPDTTVKAALFEDTAAVIGLALAAVGPAAGAADRVARVRRRRVHRDRRAADRGGGPARAWTAASCSSAGPPTRSCSELIRDEIEGTPGVRPAARAADHARRPGHHHRRGPGGPER